MSQNEVFGKVFLIKDTLPKLDWELQSETKNIGLYTCYKATIKRMMPVMQGGISVNGDKDLNDDKDETPEMKEVTIVAWYTPEIPVGLGPSRFYGLPGLILEVNDGQETIVCSRLVLNTKDKFEIIEPTRGKEITQKRFEMVVGKRMQEERERYEHNRGGYENSHSIEIRIGG